MPAPGYLSSQQSFGPGVATILAGQAWAGLAPLDAVTPIRIGLVQSLGYEVDLKLKPAYGPAIFPVAFGAGQGSVKLKIKMLSISGWAINAMLYGQAVAPAQGYQILYNQPYTIPASTPYTIVIAAAKQDLGVFYQVQNVYPSGVYSQQLMPVASAPAIAQYSFAPATGTYTFAAADTGKQLVITYATQPTTPYYYRWSLGNPIQSSPPTFQIQFTPFFNGQSNLITLPACNAEKFSLPTKQGDWVEYEVDAQAFSIGDNGTIFTHDLVAQ
jgi:hypothetical protein